MKKKFCFALMYAFLCIMATVKAQTSKVEVRGENFEIFSLEEGQRPFFNRTNMSFTDIPKAYAAYRFTKINANTATRPGPLPVLEVKIAETGYITVMVANGENTDVCESWATTNGWERLDGSTLNYGAGPMQTLFFYRKRIPGGEWTRIVQPATFSGAILIAPSLEMQGLDERLKSVPVEITSLGWMETDRLINGTAVYANRAYTYENVPEVLKDLQVTRYNGGAAPQLHIKAVSTGTLYIATFESEVVYAPEKNGWKKAEGLQFNYTDGTRSTFVIYSKEVKEGDCVDIRTTDWQGILVLSEKITYEKIEHLVPPPGVVIYNSPANTKMFVGSPSITVLKDGTYLSSHDIFGQVVSSSFVYQSKDRGKTWEQIARIAPLTWSKLFTRGDELYLLGIAPRDRAAYGHIVILKSENGGHTWTSPTDNRHGLLRAGFYHAAPTPVVFHNGRIWKGVESNNGNGSGWGPFSAFVMSAPEDADLLDASNWTYSNELLYEAGTVPATNWLEGNIVIAKDGSVKDVLRLHYMGDDRAAVVSISDDGKRATFDPYKDIANVPGAYKKFTIRYDSVSNRYWTLSNFVLAPDRFANMERARNTIVSAYSEDLMHWTVKDTLLHHDDVTTHGFQYLDWQFEGDDIIAVSRTAWDDSTGLADNQHNANYLTFHRFRNFRYESAASAKAVSLPRWYKGYTSAFALTFDDGFPAHYTYAFPLLKKYTIQSTFFVNSGLLVDRGRVRKEGRGYREDFREMAQQGQEIASHSFTHPNLASIDYATMTQELQKDKEAIEAMTGKPCLVHAYPYCQHNVIVDEVASRLFIAARQCGHVPTVVPTEDLKWLSINSELLTWIYPRSLANEKASFETLKAKIDRLNGAMGAVCIHETVPFEKLNTSDSYEIATTEWLEDVCKYLTACQEQGKIWVTTFSNMVRYAKERENLYVLSDTLADGSLALSFSTLLDTAIYNLPLTVECNLPKNWSEVKATLFNLEGEKKSVRKFVPVHGKITLDVLPDRQKLVLTCTRKGRANTLSGDEAF